MSEVLFHPAFAWLYIAVLFAILEIAVRAFGFIFGSFAAVVAAIAAIYIPGWEMQTVIFAAVAILGVVFIRPRWIKKFHSSSQGFPSRAESLIGKQGLITKTIDPVAGTGRVLVEGQDWAASSSQTVGEGTAVVIVSADGIVLGVRPADIDSSTTTEKGE